MDLFWTVLTVLLLIGIPKLLLILCEKLKVFNALKPVFLCYAVGFLLSFLLPSKASEMASTLAEVCIPLAIPLILFSANLSPLRRLAKPMLKSFALLCVAVAIITSLSFVLFRNTVADTAHVSGMLTGVYIGGTPNLIAIGKALGIDNSVILLANTADMIIGGIYFFLLISVLPPLLRRFLPAYKSVSRESEPDLALEKTIENQYLESGEGFRLRAFVQFIPPILLALAAVAVSLGMAWLLTGNATNVLVIMVGVTTIGVALSFVPKVRSMSGAYPAGQYFIYMFSIAMGLSFDISIVSSSALMLLLMVLFVQLGSVGLHALFARLARIDADTTIITSTAGIFGPPFIPSVASALKNPDIVLPGLLCGILGIVIGNYAGIGIALLLSAF